MSETILVLARNWHQYHAWRRGRPWNTTALAMIDRPGVFRGRRNGHPVIALEGWWADLSEESYARTMQELIITQADLRWEFP